MIVSFVGRQVSSEQASERERNYYIFITIIWLGPSCEWAGCSSGGGGGGGGSGGG